MDVQVPMEVVVSIGAVLGPALVALGIWLGSLRASVRSAHLRLNSLEENLKREVHGLRGDIQDLAGTLKESIRESWMHCPLAQKEHHKGGE